MKKWNWKFNAVSVAFFISLIFLILYIYNRPVLASAGDLNIAGYLVSESKPGYYFISPYIAYPLRWLYLAIPGVSWWVCFSIFSIALSVFVWIFCVWNIVENKELRWCLTIAIVGVFWFGICDNMINFTQTAACLTLSGIFLLWWNGYFAQKKRKTVLVAGMFLTMLGWFVRWKAALFCLPFVLAAGMWVVLKSIFEQETVTQEKCLKDKMKKIDIRKVFKHNTAVLDVLMGCLIAVIFLFAYGAINQEWREYYQANSLRESVYDYYKQYPKYNENRELYQSIGVNRTMMKMIHANLTADQNHFSSDVLSQIYALKQPNRITAESVKAVADTMIESPVCLVLILCVIVFLLLWKEQSFVPLLLQTMAFIACGGYLAYIGRTKWRVVICVLLAYLLGCVISVSKNQSRNLQKSKVYIWIAGLCMVIACVSIGVKRYHFTIPKAQVKNEEIDAYLSYIDAHKENLYVMSKRELRYYAAHTIWDSPEMGYCSNLVTYRAHFVLGQSEVLSTYGIENLFEELIVNPHVLSQYDKVVYEYLNENYHPCITASVVDDVNGFEIVRYMKPIDAAGEKGSLQKLEIRECFYDKENNRLRLVLQVEETDKIRYMNLYTPDGIVHYTYEKRKTDENVVFEIYVPKYVLENAGELQLSLTDENNCEYTELVELSKAMNQILEN